MVPFCSRLFLKECFQIIKRVKELLKNASFIFQDVDYGNSTDDYGAGDWQQQEQPQVQALITW